MHSWLDTNPIITLVHFDKLCLTFMAYWEWLFPSSKDIVQFSWTYITNDLLACVIKVNLTIVLTFFGKLLWYSGSYPEATTVSSGWDLHAICSFYSKTNLKRYYTPWHSPWVVLRDCCFNENLYWKAAMIKWSKWVHLITLWG